MEGPCWRTWAGTRWLSIGIEQAYIATLRRNDRVPGFPSATVPHGQPHYADSKPPGIRDAQCGRQPCMSSVGAGPGASEPSGTSGFGTQRGSTVATAKGDLQKFSVCGAPRRERISHPCDHVTLVSTRKSNLHHVCTDTPDVANTFILLQTLTQPSLVISFMPAICIPTSAWSDTSPQRNTVIADLGSEAGRWCRSG